MKINSPVGKFLNKPNGKVKPAKVGGGTKMNSPAPKGSGGGASPRPKMGQTVTVKSPQKKMGK